MSQQAAAPAPTDEEVAFRAKWEPVVEQVNAAIMANFDAAFELIESERLRKAEQIAGQAWVAALRAVAGVADGRAELEIGSAEFRQGFAIACRSLARTLRETADAREAADTART